MMKRFLIRVLLHDYSYYSRYCYHDEHDDDVIT